MHHTRSFLVATTQKRKSADFGSEAKTTAFRTENTFGKSESKMVANTHNVSHNFVFGARLEALEGQRA